MDVFLEPLPEVCEVSLGDLTSQGRDALLRVLEELAGIHRPQRVRWEVAKCKGPPVNVLEAAFLVGRNVNAKVLLDSLCPTTNTSTNRPSIQRKDREREEEEEGEC